MRIIEADILNYEDGLKIQQEHFDCLTRAKLEGINAESVLILCEHEHVYTLGKSGDEHNLLINDSFLKSIKASYYKTNRGGDITYHGPGQLVGYPILDLDILKMTLRKYVYQLEESVIKTIQHFDICGERLDGATGVWIDVGKPRVRKICAMGIKASRGITMHGFALNVNTDLNYFNHINPCGFLDKGVTSIEKETGILYSMKEIKAIYIKEFQKIF